jgi:hypothetical protein
VRDRLSGPFEALVRPRRRQALRFGLAGAGQLWLCASGRAQATPSLAVIAHPLVPAAALKDVELAAVFTAARRTWEGGEAIKLFNLPPQTEARVEFDRVVLKMTPEQSAQFWLDRRIRGEGTPPRQVPSPDLLVRVVAALAGAISYVPEDKVGKGVKVVARVRGGKVVGP